MFTYKPDKPLYPQSNPDDSIRDGFKVLKYFGGAALLFAFGIGMLVVALLSL